MSRKKTAFGGEKSIEERELGLGKEGREGGRQAGRKGLATVRYTQRERHAD